MPEKFYEYIKNMSEEEMNHFIYWVYMHGQLDADWDLRDDESGFFGHLASIDSEEVFDTCEKTNSKWQ